jgi:UDP-N-acetylglucosamine--N-acetylmuramyl-(pentapeptide) pyrophosphoryl-undecaprenol N-acetylglucosamine transferase
VEKSSLEGKKIMVTGGGSGGHIAAARFVMEYMVKSGIVDKAQLVYLGGELAMMGEKGVASLEKRTIEAMGYRFLSIRGGKLHRFFTLDQIRQMFLFLAGFVDAFSVLRKEKPDILFSTGGFVTVPAVIFAKLMGIPVVLHEQTVVSGLANRISAKFADKICVSYESSMKYFPQNKTIVTGNPINHALFETDISKVKAVDPIFQRKFQGMLRDKTKYPILFMTGGGQGAHQLNEIFFEKLEELLRNYSLILQVGDNQVFKDYDHFIEKISKLPTELADRVIVSKFYGDEFGPIINAAEVVISRGGANTIFELEIFGKRAIIVPLDGVSSDEQYNNAMRLKEKNMAIVARQSQFNSEVLDSSLKQAFELQKPIQTAKDLKYKAEKNITKVLSSVFLTS